MKKPSLGVVILKGNAGFWTWAFLGLGLLCSFYLKGLFITVFLWFLVLANFTIWYSLRKKILAYHLASQGILPLGLNS